MLKEVWKTIYFIFDGDIPLMVLGFAGIIAALVFLYVTMIGPWIENLCSKYKSGNAGRS